MSDAGADLLARIPDERRRRLEAMRAAVPAHVLKSRLGMAAPAGRLERALRRPGTSGSIGLICEFRRAAPAGGLLNADADPVTYARLYRAGGAAAVSVATEPDHFGGDLEWVTAVRAAIGLPILLDDFVLDTYQLLDAAVRGADGVLLLGALLSDTHLQRLVSDARLLGLDPLVEVHDEKELRRAVRAGATILGLCRRDPRTLAVDPGDSAHLLPLVPPLVTAVVQSDRPGPEDLHRLRPTRCDAVLVGEALMTGPDPAARLAALAAAALG